MKVDAKNLNKNLLAAAVELRSQVICNVFEQLAAAAAVNHPPRGTKVVTVVVAGREFKFADLATLNAVVQANRVAVRTLEQVGFIFGVADITIMSGVGAKRKEMKLVFDARKGWVDYDEFHADINKVIASLEKKPAAKPAAAKPEAKPAAKKPAAAAKKPAAKRKPRTAPVAE